MLQRGRLAENGYDMNLYIDYDVKMVYRFTILAREGPSPETVQQAERGVASTAARKAVNEKPGAVARHEQWLAASSLPAGSRR